MKLLFRFSVEVTHISPQCSLIIRGMETPYWFLLLAASCLLTLIRSVAPGDLHFGFDMAPKLLNLHWLFIKLISVLGIVVFGEER
jgi:hypothetical protein